eukprot:TRINITY_DN1707_c2_g1_i1.p1 TRINITY_DN1707_c2_g1~~TRINITY_DN1707_c2_g1_i1.p1  ORF type:complete len:303 (-),score=58.18 TRINITY_DN1707_c2_g1_i1:148-1056(-)
MLPSQKDSLLRDKLLGKIPRGKESPFGDFPRDFARPASNFSMFGSSLVRSTGSKSLPDLGAAGRGVGPKTLPVLLKKGSGSGGTCSSLAQARTQVDPGPPKAGALSRRNITITEFRRAYERGDVPAQVSYAGAGAGKQIGWKVDVERLDYITFLPLFFEGLREKEDPYRFLAVTGTHDLLERGGTKILPAVPQLILPLKAALNTRDPEVVATILKVLQKLVQSADMVGEALVPYYRQILPVFNLFKDSTKGTGAAIDYGQRRRMNLGELVDETLELFESHGGEDAFINIKYMIPTYQSCVIK